MRGLAALAATLLRTHEGGAVLVVGGPASLQQFLRQLTGSGSAGPGVGDPDLLYIVSVPSFGRPQVLRLRY